MLLQALVPSRHTSHAATDARILQIRCTSSILRTGSSTKTSQAAQQTDTHLEFNQILSTSLCVPRDLPLYWCCLHEGLKFRVGMTLEEDGDCCALEELSLAPVALDFKNRGTRITQHSKPKPPTLKIPQSTLKPQPQIYNR